MPRGRRKETDKRLEWKLRIPQSVADPVTARLAKQNLLGEDKGPPLGARSELTSMLYRKWLREKDLEDNLIETLKQCEDLERTDVEASQSKAVTALLTFLEQTGRKRVSESFNRLRRVYA
jgi:hypothetical protein